MKAKKKYKHVWVPVESSKGFWGYHQFDCSMCGERTHIGLDIDYEAADCSRSKIPREKGKRDLQLERGKP